MTCPKTENEHEEDEVTKYYRKYCKKLAKDRRRGKTRDYRVPSSRWVYDTPRRSDEDSKSNTSSDPEFLRGCVTPSPIARVRRTAEKCSLQPVFIQRNEMKILVPGSEEQDFSTYQMYSNGDSDEEKENAQVESSWNLKPMPLFTPRKEKIPTRQFYSPVCRKLF